MGIIRKTMSVGTLGLVSFRSKKEKLRKAEAQAETAAADLLREHQARELAEQRVAKAEKKAREAELLAVLDPDEQETLRRLLKRLLEHAGPVDAAVGED